MSKSKYQIIMIKAHITEKTLKLAESGKYTFELSRSRRINKIELAKFVKEQFKVTPVKVNTLKKLGRRFAVVQLKPNEKIDGFEVKTEKK
ncbi:50S ribosomal protein L23 [Candidatus Berkelbacteria bacterium]|nr:50S ribosomal protein L23 [Candidatus Berkelbacteria bacterium]